MVVKVGSSLLDPAARMVEFLAAEPNLPGIRRECYASKRKNGASSMARQLNIRSDEAYKIAHWLAKTRGRTVTEVVTDALRRAQGECEPAPEVSPEQAAETIRILMELSERSAKAAKPGTTSDHSYLYDEHGLPK
jgi:hypothetical protein